MYSNETTKGLYLCVNGNAELFGEFVGICSEDDCEYGESLEEGKISSFSRDIAQEYSVQSINH